MRILIVEESNKGQRLDKLLFKYLKEAPSSFVYKMLRKKNIVLNGKKANGTEILNQNDEIKLFLSDETVEKFMGKTSSIETDKRYFDPDIIYEDENIICVNKHAGILSQKSSKDDYSMNELLIDYLIIKGELTEFKLRSFRPSVLNRLDRNTEGLILFGKTYVGASEISCRLKDRTIHKYYYCVVTGIINDESLLDGYLVKNADDNKVVIKKDFFDGSSKITTRISPVRKGDNVTLMEVELITGKTHQIRAHLSSIGHPIIGDMKYGNKKVNEKYKKLYGINHQMLFSHKIIFPCFDDLLSNLSNKIIELDVPKIYEDVLNGNMEKQRP